MTGMMGDLVDGVAPLPLDQRVARLERILGLGPTPGGETVPWPLRRAAVLKAAARLWFITVEEILGPRQFREYSLARAAIVLVLREGTPLSYPQLGKLLNRNHSSIIHLEHMARRAMNERPGFQRAVEELRATFQAKEETPA